ncbi:MAG: hypothetical protein ACP5NS_02955 [Candidatus Pacearchaeota archaeon]
MVESIVDLEPESLIIKGLLRTGSLTRYQVITKLGIYDETRRDRALDYLLGIKAVSVERDLSDSEFDTYRLSLSK